MIDAIWDTLVGVCALLLVVLFVSTVIAVIGVALSTLTGRR